MPLTPKDAATITRDITRLAIVGVAKNCGKTTTLNALLANLGDRSVGLISIGIDGEPEDLLIGTPKPTIHVAPDHLLVTARAALERSSARVEYVDTLDIHTPMGEVLLVRVLTRGSVMLAGIRHREDLRVAIEKLEAHGADLVLIDGAYGRTIAAHRDLSDGFILSTGAILSSSVDEIARKTAALAKNLTREAPTLAWHRALLERAMREDRALIGAADGEVVPLPMRSALVGLGKGRALWTPARRAIAIPGLISDRVIEELLRVPEIDGKRALLAASGTSIKAAPRLVERLSRGWDIYSGGRSDLRAVSMNPTSIAGMGVEAGALKEALARLLPDALIIDPC